MSPVSRHSSPARWTGETYYERPQLKASPFEPHVVGGYIFLAGLSGAAALIGTIANAADARHRRRRPRSHRDRYASLVRRSDVLSWLAPALGAPLLIYDLHTPQRFYNMLRVAKKTSPMSIGTWILMSFSSCIGVGTAARFLAHRQVRWHWPRRLAAATRLPAAAAGAGLASYTAALLSGTSTPLWAAAPRSLAVRFASSSMAAGAAASAIGERDPAVRDKLQVLLAAAVVTEAVATALSDGRIKALGLEAGRSGRWGKIEKYGGAGLGVAAPLGLLVAARLQGRNRGLADAAGYAAIAGSLLMRISLLGAGNESALRPDVSMAFAQPRRGA